MSRVRWIRRLLLLAFGIWLAGSMSNPGAGRFPVPEEVPVLSRHEQQPCPEPRHLGFPPAEGPILQVPQDFPTIQAAIDAAPQGATIRIAPGVYQENLIVRKSVHIQGVSRDHVVIRSAHPFLATVLVVSTNIHTLVWIENVSITENWPISRTGSLEIIGVPQVLIQDSALRKTYTYTAGFPGDMATGVIALCRNLFENGEIELWPGGSQAIMLVGNILNNTPINVRYSQRAVPYSPYSDILPRVSIEENVIRASPSSMWAILLYDAQGVRIRGNSIEGTIYGIAMSNKSEALIKENLIRGHRDAGIAVRGDSLARLQDNRIEGNGRQDHEITAGIVIILGKVELENNKISNNLGWGILTTNTANVVVCKNNQVAENKLGDYGWYWIYPYQSPRVSLELKQKCEGGS